MKLILTEPFKSLWAGRDAFAEVERLEGGDVPRTGRASDLADRSRRAWLFCKIHRGVAGAKCLRTCCVRCPCWGPVRVAGHPAPG